MAYVFTKDLETGNQLIDSEHRQLIDAINNLLTACSTAKAVQSWPIPLSFYRIILPSILETRKNSSFRVSILIMQITSATMKSLRR